MDAVATLARSLLRRGALAAVLLALVSMVAGGAVLACLAGARRQSTVIERFVDFHRPAHAQVSSNPEDPIDLDAVEALPQVASAGRGAYLLLTVEGPSGGEQRLGLINPFVLIQTGGSTYSIPHVVEGSEPDPADLSKVMIDEEAADRTGAGVGAPLVLRAYLPEQLEEFYADGEPRPPGGKRIEVEVGAVIRTPYDVRAINPPDIEVLELGSAELYVGSGFWEAHSADLAYFGGVDEGTELRLHEGPSDFPDFLAAVRALPGGSSADIELRNDAQDTGEDAQQVVTFEAVALLVTGLLLLAAALVVVGQAITRQVRSDLGDRDLLLAIGFSRRDLSRATVLRIAPVAVAAGAGAVLIAWAVSSRLPIGLGRTAEIEPGRSFDAAILLPGGLLIALLVMAWGWVNGHRSPTAVVSDSRGVFGWSGDRLVEMGAPVSTIVGLSQLTPATRSRRSAPVRPALGTGVLGVASMVAAGVFAASLANLIDTPALHGWGWSVLAGDSDDPDLESEGPHRLAANPAVAGFAAVSSGFGDPVSVGGDELGLAGVDSLQGGTYPRLIDGVMATEADEIVMTPGTLRRSGVELGDEVLLDVGDDGVPFTVVGEALLTEWLSFDVSLDDGAIVTRDGLERVAPESGLGRYLVDFTADADPEAAIESLREDFGLTVIPPLRPLEIENYRRIQGLPTVLAGLVGVLGLASLVHLLLVTVRRGRRDLAVLSVLGARRSSARAVLASTGTAVAVVAVALGVPAGFIVGRWLWRTVATAIGAPAPVVTPVGAIAMAVAAVLVIANAASLLAGDRARRLRLADVLRSE